MHSQQPLADYAIQGAVMDAHSRMEQVYKPSRIRQAQSLLEGVVDSECALEPR